MHATKPYAIETSGLRKSFGPTLAVAGIDLRVRTGTIYGLHGLLGPNGAGKTTTIRMLATLLRPDGGRATVLGHDVAREPDAVRRRISLTRQFASVDEDLTGSENLRLLARLLGFSRSDARARTAELLEAFGIADAAGRRRHATRVTPHVSKTLDVDGTNNSAGRIRMRIFIRPTAIVLPLLVAAASTSACGGDVDTSATWTGTVDTLPDGRVAVRSESPTWAEAARPVFEEQLRLGSMMGEGPEAFGQVRDLLLDDEGRIYVLESQAQEIRVFGPDGDWLHTIGRQGEGPGELKNAAAMGWGPDGVLRVVDYGNGRISDFRRDGTFVTSHRQQGGFVMYPWPGEFGRDGGLINVSPFIRDGEFEPVLVRYTPDMEPADTLTIPRYEGDSEYFEHASEGGGGIRASVPFGAGLSWDLDPRGYFWVAPNTATYEVSQVSLSGDTLLTIRRPSEPHPVTSAEVDSAAAMMKWFTDQGGKIDRSKFPSSKPALTRVFAPGEGHLYVVPVTDEFGSGYLSTSDVLDVFGPDGRYLGRLDLPEGMATSNPEPVFRDDHVLAVVRDELDVPYVVRYRLAPPGEVLGEAVS